MGQRWSRIRSELDLDIAVFYDPDPIVQIKPDPGPAISFFNFFC